MSELLLPHFLGIGAVKAGTTWLHRNLHAHPDLYLAIRKPLYFWDRHRDKGLDSYARIFRPGRDKLRGEFTASYSVLPAATRTEIRELLPELRLILVLREPRDRAWSEAKMELTVVQGRDADTLTEQDYLDFLRSEKCRERGDYPAIIRAWTASFPREQVHIALYDDIAQRPEEFLAGIFAFLGVATPENWDDYPLHRRIFKGPELPLPPRCAELLDAMYTRGEIERTAALSGLDLVRAWGY